MKNIKKMFEKFGIYPTQYPKYENPNDFALTFKKCSVLKNSPITYSNSTISSSPLNTSKENFNA